MSRRGLTFAVAAALIAVLAVLATVLPVPYVILVPGPVTDTLGDVPTASGGTRPVVAVSGAQSYPPSGHLYLTTVGVVPGSCDRHPTLLQALRSWFNDTQAVEPQQVICPPGESSTAVQHQNEQDMSQSQVDAITAALLHLGYKPLTERVVVAEILDPKSPAASVLQQADVILAVDGHAISTADELRTQVGAHPIGTALRLTIERGGKKQDVVVKTIDSGDGSHRAVIGIKPDLHATFKNVKVTIGIDPAQVGGPSAGLAFTLGIIDKLTPGDLTGGRTVAATGTIDAFGTVGPIGGIQQKIAGALRAHATAFLVPTGDCADAKKVAPSSLVLVKVDTLDTALAALGRLATGSGTFPRC
ncbi:MAG: Lon-like protease [Frankiaceae bacterium]|jgi:PDZ domain-containing protein|nr:Lon-like protease [Frankiaceae bacterium]